MYLMHFCIVLFVLLIYFRLPKTERVAMFATASVMCS